MSCCSLLASRSGDENEFGDSAAVNRSFNSSHSLYLDPSLRPSFERNGVRGEVGTYRVYLGLVTVVCTVRCKSRSARRPADSGPYGHLIPADVRTENALMWARVGAALVILGSCFPELKGEHVARKTFGTSHLHSRICEAMTY
jgi:hypothetical protein